MFCKNNVISNCENQHTHPSVAGTMQHFQAKALRLWKENELIKEAKQ